MDTMKGRPKIANQMDKVCSSYLLFYTSFLILCFIGKFFWNNGNRYEGKWKDDIMHGQGKKEDIYFLIYLFIYLFILTLFGGSKGEWFGNDGDRYEGEFKDNR